MNRRFHTASLFAMLALWCGVFAAPAWGDPPARVGRISFVEGEVSLRETYDADADQAERNWPVTSDNVITTGRDARAEIRIGSSAIALDRDTEIEFAVLDDERIGLRLLQGRLALDVRGRDAAEDFEISSAQGRTLLLEAGRYRFDAEPDGESGAVTVFTGRARFDAAGSSLDIAEGESLRISGPDGQTLRMGEARRSELDDWHLARARRGERPALRYVSPDMTGYEDLDDYGTWRDTDDYGAVWLPQGLPADWAPYRHGRWAWVEPWGWTWIDDLPWGFAPFHYGRWLDIGGSWAWAPGRIVARPVYAPALVVWIGSPGVSLGIGVGSTPAVGWFPLAPREVFVPAYKCSTGYLRNLNLTHVRHIEHTDVTRIQYRHRHSPRAVTLVSAAAVAGGRPVHREFVRVRERRELGNLVPAATPRDLRPLPRAERRSSPFGERGRGAAPETPRRAENRWRERDIVESRERDRTRRSGGGQAAALPDARPGRLPGLESQRPQQPNVFRRDADRRDDAQRREAAPDARRIPAPPAAVPETRGRGEEMRNRSAPADAAAVERERRDAQRRSEEQRRAAEQRRAVGERQAEAEDEARRRTQQQRERDSAERERRSAQDGQRQAAEEQQRRAAQAEQRRRAVADDQRRVEERQQRELRRSPADAADRRRAEPRREPAAAAPAAVPAAVPESRRAATPPPREAVSRPIPRAALEQPRREIPQRSERAQPGPGTQPQGRGQRPPPEEYRDRSGEGGRGNDVFRR